MPKAARLHDPATHLMKPIAPGVASATVRIGSKPAWRALPAGLGSGVESALNSMKQLMDSPTLNPATTPALLAQVHAGLSKDAAAAEQKGSPGATATTTAEYAKLTATNIRETTTYTSAAAAPGGQPAALAAYTLAMKKAAADFAGAVIQSIAGMTDTHVCPQPSGAIPHGPGVVTKGSRSVFINGLPACREGDKLFEAAGGSDPIARGCDTVIIGDAGGSGGGSASRQDATPALPPPTAEPGGGGGGSGDPPDAAIHRARDRGRKHWVAFRVVLDRTSAPVAGVSLQVTLPNGRTETRATDGDGRVEFSDLDTPGVCGVSCPLKDARLATTFDFVASGETPVASQDLYWKAAEDAGRRRGGVIAEIEEHRVRTGETLASVARQAGMTETQLALFNWNTVTPDELSRHLRDDVGCRRKSADGRNYVFDNADDPGIVYVPRAWRQAGLATDQVHTLRVRELAHGQNPRRIRLFDWAARAIPGAPYAVEINEGEVARGVADANGDIELPETKASVATIRWSRPGSMPPPLQTEVDPVSGEPVEIVSDAEFEFAREIYIDPDELAPQAESSAQDADRRRLNNMGYSAGHSVAENVGNFQRDVRQAITGLLEDVLAGVREHHDDRSQPPRSEADGATGEALA